MFPVLSIIEAHKYNIVSMLTAHDQQKEAVKESYVMWSHNVFNSQPSCFPNYTYCPAADHMPKHHAVLRNPSPPQEDQFED